MMYHTEGDMIDTEFRRGQNAAFDAMWEAVGQAEHELRDDAGTIDPYARAVLAVVRGQLDAVVSAIDGEWACEERVQRARENAATPEKIQRGEGSWT